MIHLLETFGFETVFGRSDVQKELGLKPTRCSELLREMVESEITLPVSGFGKGKYRFVAQSYLSGVREHYEFQNNA